MAEVVITEKIDKDKIQVEKDLWPCSTKQRRSDSIIYIYVVFKLIKHVSPTKARKFAHLYGRNLQYSPKHR